MIALLPGFFLTAGIIVNRLCYSGFDNQDRKHWISGFGMTGVIDMLTD